MHQAQQKDLVHLVLEPGALLFHFFDRKIIDRHVFFLEMLDLAGQVVILVKHLAEKTIRGSQYLHYIQKLWELAVKLVMLNLHDRALSLFLARRKCGQMWLKNTGLTACLATVTPE